MTTAYDVNGLPANLNTWMNQRFLMPILNIEGGWEAWMQIDFPAWLDTTYNQQYDFRREVPFVNPNGRVDWLINSAHPPPTGVELKAQTHKYLTSTLLVDVAADVNKLTQWKASGQITYALSIVAAIDPNAVQQLSQRGFVQWFVYQEVVTFMGNPI